MFVERVDRPILRVDQVFALKAFDLEGTSDVVGPRGTSVISVLVLTLCKVFQTNRRVFRAE